MRHAKSTGVALCAAVWLLAGIATGDQNLVVNGSFDLDGSGWTAADQDIQLVYRADTGSTLAGGSGPGSLEVQHRFWNGSSSGATQTITVGGGTTYAVAFSYFAPLTDNVANSASVYLAWRNADGWALGSDWVTGYPFVNDAWTAVTGEVTAPADAATAVVSIAVGNPVLSGETRPGVVLFDDVSVSVKGVTTASQTLFVPAAAAVHGLAGTYWSTDAWVTNLTAATVTVAGVLLRQGQDNGGAVASPTSLGTIPANGFLKLSDLVSTLGGSEVAGGIYLLATAEGGDLPATLIAATTHTYTPNPYGDGVYGQGIAAVAAGVKARTAVPGVFQGSDLRTNVGALNTSPTSISLTVTVRDAAGVEKATATWTLQPYEQRQVSLPSLGVASLDGGTVVFELTSGGSFRGYTSTVDQHSGDAVYNEAR